MKKNFATVIILLAVQTITSFAAASDIEILTQKACADSINKLSDKKMTATTYYVNGVSKYRPGDINYEVTTLNFSHETGLQISLGKQSEESKSVTNLTCIKNKKLNLVDVEAIGNKKLSFTLRIEN